MVKLRSRKQRGIQKGIGKHRIRFNESEDLFSWLIGSVLSTAKLKYLNRFSRVCFFSTVKACMYLALVLLSMNSERKFVLASRRKRALHCLIMTLLLLLTFHRLVVTIQAANTFGLGLQTYLCAAYAIIVTLGMTASLGSSVQCIETYQMFNSAQSLVDPLDSILDTELDPFGRPVFCLRAVALTCICYASALNAASFSVIFDNLPVCIYPILRRNDLIPDVGLPSIAWRIIFFPAELVTILPPGWITIFNLKMGCFGFEQFPMYVEGMRRIKTRSVRQWEQVNHLFNCLRVYNIMFGNYTKYVLGPSLLAIGTAVIILLYITIRPSDLPLYIHVWFPVIAVLTMLVCNWLMYDAVQSKRGSEDLQADHQNQLNPFFKSLPPSKRKELVLRAGVHRPVVVTVGEFSEISFELFVSMWDEVINQLLFLLTL